ncbi:MAG: tyrosine-protein phosphatase [Deltaproteobacteria bacterium]|nr:tyrosine-protein phosphatase [Deltaproteobacteria bacterium]
MKRKLIVCAVWAVFLLIPAGCNPLLNFGVIVSNKFFRSGQPDNEDLFVIKDKLKIKTILNLKVSVDGHENKFAKKNKIRIIHMPMSAKRPPTNEQLNIFFDIIQNKSLYPLWMHCQGGADRTGVMAAVYRLEFENWSKWSALFEMIRYLHIPFRYPQLTRFIFFYERRFGSYQETPKELEELKTYLQSQDLWEDKEKE